jgi:hypothetical protein
MCLPTWMYAFLFVWRCRLGLGGVCLFIEVQKVFKNKARETLCKKARLGALTMICFTHAQQMCSRRGKWAEACAGSKFSSLHARSLVVAGEHNKENTQNVWRGQHSTTPMIWGG